MWEQKGEDKGRWTEYVNTETHESSIKEHKLKVIWKSCKDGKHKWLLTGNRELTCERCNMVKPFILGMEKLVGTDLVKVDR